MGARRLEDDVTRPDESWDQLDVPAAVVCALCGDPMCAGCGFESTTKSGIVAIVPWERPGMGLFARLWATARATTRDPDAFFGALPDGSIASALGFAILAELLAATSWAVVAVGGLAALRPRWTLHVMVDPHPRSIALRALLAALPAFALLLASAHAFHGVALDHGARRVGAKGARRRALRFGLFAAGWDLVIGPLGAVLLACLEGFDAAKEVTHFGAGLPTRSATSFLRGVYGLDPPRIRRALTSSHVAAVVATLVAAFVVVGALVTAVLLYPPHLLSY